MARALMGEDFEADDGEAMLSDEELAQGTDAAAEVLADALEEERGEEAAAIAAGRAKIEDDEAAEAAGGGEDAGAARASPCPALPPTRSAPQTPTPCSLAPSHPR